MNILKKTIPYISIIVLLVAESVFITGVYKLQILPRKYFIIFITALCCISFLIAFLLFFKGRKNTKGKGKVKIIVAYALSAIMVVLSGFGSFASFKFNYTLNAIASNKVTESCIGVYVLADDPAETIADLSDYKVGYFDQSYEDKMQEILTEIKNEIDGSFSPEEYDTVLNLVEALYKQEIKAIIVDVSYIELLKEIDAFSDFSAKTKLIRQYTVLEENENTEEKVNDTKSVYDPFIVYLSGSDTRSNYLAKSRSDVNILAVVSFTTHQLLLINTPRDYYIPNPAGNGALDKLTHCGIYGVSCSSDALEDLYECEVSYCAQINFPGFESLVDSIGGITVYSDVSVTAKVDKYSIKKGENFMNGDQALYYARDRHSYASGDNARGNHQMEIIKAIVEKMLTGKMFTRYAEILDSLEGMFNTDMSKEVMAKLIQKQIEEMSRWEIFTYAVTGTGGSNTTYSMPGFYAYVMYPNEESVQKAQVLINKLLSGEAITQSEVG